MPQRTSVGQDGKQSPVPAAEELTSIVDLAEPLASARQLAYLLVKDPSRLETKEQQALAFIKQERENHRTRYWTSCRMIACVCNHPLVMVG